MLILSPNFPFPSNLSPTPYFPEPLKSTPLNKVKSSEDPNKPHISYTLWTKAKLQAIKFPKVTEDISGFAEKFNI